MVDRKKYLNILIKRLSIVFWILFAFTIVLAFREYQYLAVSHPGSGNWVIDNTNSVPNSYLYEWISYINIVLVVVVGALTFTVYIIKKLFEDLRMNYKKSDTTV